MTPGINKVTSVTSEAMDGREEYGEYSLASPGYRGAMTSYPGQYPGEQIMVNTLQANEKM